MLVELDDDMLDKVLSQRLLDDYFSCKEYSKASINNEDVLYYLELEKTLKKVLKYYMIKSTYEEVFGEGSY